MSSLSFFLIKLKKRVEKHLQQLKLIFLCVLISHFTWAGKFLLAYRTPQGIYLNEL